MSEKLIFSREEPPSSVNYSQPATPSLLGWRCWLGCGRRPGKPVRPLWQCWHFGAIAKGYYCQEPKKVFVLGSDTPKAVCGALTSTRDLSGYRERWERGKEIPRKVVKLLRWTEGSFIDQRSSPFEAEERMSKNTKNQEIKNYPRVDE